jgi:hypothetical protein
LVTADGHPRRRLAPDRSRMNRPFGASPSKYPSRPGIHEMRVPSELATTHSKASASGGEEGPERPSRSSPPGRDGLPGLAR